MNPILSVKEVTNVYENRDDFDGIEIATKRYKIRMLISNNSKCCENWGYEMFVDGEKVNNFYRYKSFGEQENDEDDQEEDEQEKDEDDQEEDEQENDEDEKNTPLDLIDTIGWNVNKVSWLNKLPSYCHVPTKHDGPNFAAIKINCDQGNIVLVIHNDQNGYYSHYYIIQSESINDYGRL